MLSLPCDRSFGEKMNERNSKEKNYENDFMAMISVGARGENF
jgi:phosphatidylserine decarboxylase